MPRKKLLAIMIAVGGVAATAGAFPDDNNILNWSGAANVPLAHHPGNWNPGFRPEENHHLSFGSTPDGQPQPTWRCSFDSPISAAHIPFVQSLNFSGESYTEILGDPQIQWIGDGPNLSTRMVSVGWGAYAEFQDSMYLRSDHVQVLWGSRMRVENARVDIRNHLSLLGDFDVFEQGDVQVDAGDLLLSEGRLSIAGGRMSVNGDVVLQPEQPRGSLLHVRDAYSYDVIPGIFRVHGELSFDCPEDMVNERLLWLERATIHVDALDLRSIEVNPEEGIPPLNLASGRVIIDGGPMRLRADNPLEIAPHGFGPEDRHFTLQLVNGAALHHGNDVRISNGSPGDDRLGQLNISSAGPGRSSMACHGLDVAVGSRDNGQMIMSGGADLAVMEDARFGSGRFARASLIMHDFPGIDLEPTASFFQDLRIGEDGGWGELEIKAGSTQVFGDLHLGRHKGDGALLISGDGGEWPTSVLVAGALYGAGPIDQFPENGRLHVRDGARMQVNGPGHLGFGLDLTVASGGELFIGGDAAIYNPEQVLLQGGTFAVGGAVTSEEGAISVPSPGYGGGMESVLRLSNGEVHGDLLVGDGRYGSVGILEVTANDLLTAHEFVRIGGKGGGRLRIEKNSRVILERGMALAPNAEVEVAGVLEGWSVNSIGRGVETFTVMGGQVELEHDCQLESWDPKIPSELNIRSGSDVRVQQMTRSDVASMESNAIVETRRLSIRQDLRFLLKKQPETNTPIVTAQGCVVYGRVEIHGNKHIVAANIGQRWPLVQAISGVYMPNGVDIEVIDNDLFDAIGYRLVPAGKHGLLAVDIVSEQPGDTDGDGDVDRDDLFEILDGMNQQCDHWNPVQKFCPTDVDRDGSTGIGDLMIWVQNSGR